MVSRHDHGSRIGTWLPDDMKRQIVRTGRIGGQRSGGERAVKHPVVLLPPAPVVTPSAPQPDPERLAYLCDWRDRLYRELGAHPGWHEWEYEPLLVHIHREIAELERRAGFF